MATSKKRPAKKKVVAKKPAKEVKAKSEYDNIKNNDGVYSYICNCGSVTMTSISLPKLKRQIDKSEDKC